MSSSQIINAEKLTEEFSLFLQSFPVYRNVDISLHCQGQIPAQMALKASWNLLSTNSKVWPFRFTSSWILKIPHLFENVAKSKDIFILSAVESAVKPIIFQGIINTE